MNPIMMRTTRETKRRWTRLAQVVSLGMILVTPMSCTDFLMGGEANKDPNRPLVANPKQLYVAIQTNTWSLYSGDLSRLAAMFTQQAVGLASQYVPTYNYSITEQTTNGSHLAFYAAGGLVDIRKLQEIVSESGDSLFLGIARVQEALQMSLAADIFGDLVYSEALQGGNPPLDDQLDIYQALLDKLDAAILNISDLTIETSAGPEEADLVYWSGGDDVERQAQRDRWIALAHSLKARIYLHLSEVDPSNYARALAEAQLGIQDPDDNYRAVYSGVAGENNMLYQFTKEQRPNQIAPNRFIIDLMASRSDPRFNSYFLLDVEPGPPPDTTFDYASSFVAPTTSQPIVTASETLLIWAEAAARVPDVGEAQDALAAYQVANGLPIDTSYTGNALLRMILTEKYIALFHQVEPWNDYKRTCFPNLVPTTAGSKIPGRLYYDSNERNTNTSIPPTTEQPTRNANDPANATDPFGAACLGQ